ncbi:MAG: helix-hairpin-helix domain-containing protein [Bacteroidia bacterium]|nr:helix-hairpin-helix domain-containing protein [Bacteroidia bacterium]MDW8333574.1 helix-hairpin-helix domain-containing protein [Bacteroidia bacterium]
MTSPFQTRALAVLTLVGFCILAAVRFWRREPSPIDAHFPVPKGILPDGRIEINLADTLAWQTVKGIGSARAKQIVRRRQKRGYFDSTDNLCEIRGVDSIYNAYPRRFVVLDSILNILRDSLGEPKTNRTRKVVRRNLVPSFNRQISADGRALRPEASGASALLDLNIADEAKLEALPGIGEILSERIVKFRNLLGGFYSVEQLREVYGLRDEHYRKCAPYLTVATPPFRKIRVNSAPVSVLGRHPYFKNYADTLVLLRPLDPKKMRALMGEDFRRAEHYVQWD